MASFGGRASWPAAIGGRFEDDVSVIDVCVVDVIGLASVVETLFAKINAGIT